MRKMMRPGTVLWTLQSLLAMLFLFAGVMKLALPAAALAAQAPVPVGLLRFIGAVETLGALGLVLPGLFRTRRFLTPLAAAGLAIVMSGAVGATFAAGLSGMAAIFPGAVGIVAAVVAVGRRGWLPERRVPAVGRVAPASSGARLQWTHG